MAEWPDARHVIVVREGYESLAPLFPKALEWKVARLNPFKQRPSECREGARAPLSDLEAMQPDLILAPTLNRTWLEIAVAAHFKKIRSVVLGGADVDPIFAASLRLDLGVDPAAAFRETVASDRATGDVDNQHRFAETPDRARAADRASRGRGPGGAVRCGPRGRRGARPPAGKWAAVFVGGLANVAVKSWPPEKFAEVVAWLQSRKIPVLLLAHADEAASSSRSAPGRQGWRRPARGLAREGRRAARSWRRSSRTANSTSGSTPAPCTLRRRSAGPSSASSAAGTGPGSGRRQGRRSRSSSPFPASAATGTAISATAPASRRSPPSDVIRAVERILGAGNKADQRGPRVARPPAGGRCG